MRSILYTVASRVCLVHTRTCLVVPKVISSLSVPSCAMEVRTPGDRAVGVVKFIYGHIMNRKVKDVVQTLKRDTN